jgi:hypothetical protein
LAAAQPSGLLVVLDDLQWADATTIRLLVHLATGRDAGPADGWTTKRCFGQLPQCCAPAVVWPS